MMSMEKNFELRSGTGDYAAFRFIVYLELGYSFKVLICSIKNGEISLLGCGGNQGIHITD
jgi:hypothetical protein